MADPRESFADLLALGRRQGYLTYAQVNACLPEGAEPTSLDQLLTMLEDEGIELADDPSPADEHE